MYRLKNGTREQTPSLTASGLPVDPVQQSTCTHTQRVLSIKKKVIDYSEHHLFLEEA